MVSQSFNHLQSIIYQLLHDSYPFAQSLTEKSNRKKKSIKILKIPTSSVWFRFYKLEIKKTEPKQKNQEKTELNRKNRAKPEKPSQTGLNRFWFFFFLKFFLI
jgi:hypothetical protein